MNQQVEGVHAAVKDAENKPDLAANYGPIGIKAVIAACLVLTSKKRLVACGRQNAIIRTVRGRFCLCRNEVIQCDALVRFERWE